MVVVTILEFVMAVHIVAFFPVVMMLICAKPHVIA
jgi:hypothetical protein